MNPSRIDFFEKIAPYYDLLLDVLTLGHYALFLKRAITLLAPQKGEKILDLCSGTGRAVSWMAEAIGAEGEVIGVDLSKRMIEVAKDRYARFGNSSFLQMDVTRRWGFQNEFDGILISFALHELPEHSRTGVFEKAFLALKERGRMVIADFNPNVSGMARFLSRLFFKGFERKNLNFFEFDQYETLKQAGFKTIQSFSIFGGLFQITLAHKNQHDFGDECKR